VSTKADVTAKYLSVIRSTTIESKHSFEKDADGQSREFTREQTMKALTDDEVDDKATALSHSATDDAETTNSSQR